MQQTKRAANNTQDDDGPPSPERTRTCRGSGSVPGYGACSSAGRRSAKSAFAEVMKQEGFSKLLSSKGQRKI